METQQDALSSSDVLVSDRLRSLRSDRTNRNRMEQGGNFMERASLSLGDQSTCQENSQSTREKKAQVVVTFRLAKVLLFLIFPLANKWQIACPSF